MFVKIFQFRNIHFLFPSHNSLTSFIEYLLWLKKANVQMAKDVDKPCVIIFVWKSNSIRVKWSFKFYSFSFLKGSMFLFCVNASIKNNCFLTVATVEAYLYISRSLFSKKKLHHTSLGKSSSHRCLVE